MVATLGDGAPASSTVQKWAAEFKRGRESLQDDPSSGHPSIATTQGNIDCVRHFLIDNIRLSVHQTANTVAISRQRVENILHKELGMSKVSAQWVPHHLMPDPKLTRLAMAQGNLALHEADPASFLESFLTQMSVGFTLRARDHMAVDAVEAPSAPAPKEAMVVSSAGKVRASVFWDPKGTVFIDDLQKWQTINGEYYANFLMQLQKAIKSKQPGKLTKGDQFHQVNVPAHKSVVAMAAGCV